MADGLGFDIGFTADPADAARAADRAADAISKVLIDAFKDLGKTLDVTLRKAIKESFDPTQVHQFTDALGQASLKTRGFEDEIANLRKDLAALGERAEATRGVLKKAGADEGLFAGVERGLQKITALQHKLNEQADRLAGDPGAIRALEAQYNSLRTSISSDVGGIQSVLKSFTTEQRQQLIRQTSDASNASRERSGILRSETSRFVVEQQREGALQLAEQRSNNARLLNAEKAHSRARIELLRFTLRQIRALERTIGSIFSAGAGAIKGAFAQIEGVVHRTGRVLKAENSAMVQGLQPALLTRERSITRSFHNQETVLRSSVVRQERALQQLNAQASRGIAGAATGRSGVGSLLGGGLAFGGIFTLIAKLKEGFTESVNFNESLNKTRQIFQDASGDIEAFAENSVEALFVTRSAALEAASNFGIFGKAAGLTGQPLADFSKRLTVLATDLASFNNTSIADATTSISAALRGESEPIRKYGVLLNEDVLQQRALAEGIIDIKRKLQPFERVLAANVEILAQTAVQQGDAARTADQFANSSRRAGAASVQFFATLGGKLVPLATLITNGLFPAFQGLTAFIEGRVGPAMQIVRDGAIGAGIALGGLLIAKAAGEALKFLAISLKLVLTPMGAIIFGIAALGAAINIFAKRSPELRRIFDNLREAVSERLRQGLDFVRTQLGRLADLIVDRVIPAVITIAGIVRDRLLDAFRATVGFVRNTVIPGFERFGVFLRDVVLPAIVDIALAVRDRLEPPLRTALTAVRGFFDTVRPLIQPVIDGFRQLGDAIRDAFAAVAEGNFGDALDRLRNFGDEAVIVAGVIGVGLAAALINPLLGIGVTIAGLAGFAFGPSLLKAVKPQIDKVLKFLKDTFSARNLQDVALGFLAMVERIGKIIGSIVTDRKFIIGIEVIIAAAVAVGGKFVLGLAKGIAQNIPELISLFSAQLKFALKEAFKAALKNPEFIVAALAGGLVLFALKRAFSAAGAAGADGFVSSFASRTRAFFARNAFFEGMFGGFSGLQAAADRQAKKEAAALSKSRLAASRDLALLGQPQTGPFVVGSAGASTTVRDTIAGLDKVKAKYGEAQIAGALFRENADRAFKSAGQAAGGFVKVLKGDVAGGFAQVKTGAKGMGTNLSQIFSRLKTDLKGAGSALGLALGQAIASGIGAVLSGQAVARAGSAGGKALGIAGIITSALFASAAFGGLSNPVGQVVAGATVAVGTLSAIFGASGRAAAEAKERIRSYTDALKDVKTNAEFTATAVEQMNNRLLGLPDSTTKLLAGAEITVQSLSRSIADGTVDLPELERKLRDAASSSGAGWVETAGAIQFVRQAVGELQSASVKLDLNESVNEPAVTRALKGVTSRVDGLREAILDLPDGRIEGQRWQEGLADEGTQRRLADTQRAVDAVGTAVDTLNQRRTDSINAQIAEVSEKLSTAREAAQLAKDAIVSFFTGGVSDTAAAAVDALIGQVGGIGDTLGQALALGPDSIIGEAGARQALQAFGDQAGAIVAKAFEENKDIDPAAINTLLAPIIASITEAAGIDGEDLFTDEAAAKLIKAITDPLQNEDFKATLDLASSAQTAADTLQGEWNRLNVALETDIKFSKVQVINALAETLGVSFSEAERLFALTLRTGPFTSGFDEAGVFLGESMVQGIATGVHNAMPTVGLAAAAEIATIMRKKVATDLEISSPSKVFMRLGAQIAEGLARGIEGGTSRVANAVGKITEGLDTGILSGIEGITTAASRAASQARAAATEGGPRVTLVTEGGKPVEGAPKVNIEEMNFVEGASPRATAREAVMALSSAALGA